MFISVRILQAKSVSSSGSFFKNAANVVSHVSLVQFEATRKLTVESNTVGQELYHQLYRKALRQAQRD